MLMPACKIAGSLCVMAAAAIFGETKARTLSRRVQQLEQFQRSLKLLSVEISFGRALLPSAIETVARRLGPPLG